MAVNDGMGGASSTVGSSRSVTVVAPSEGKPDDRWTLNVGIPDTSITFQATESWSLFPGSEIAFENSRLAGEGDLDGAGLPGALGDVIAGIPFNDGVKNHAA